MSVIEIKSYPTAHIVVRDFLDSSSKKKLLDSLLPIRENHLQKFSQQWAKHNLLYYSSHLRRQFWEQPGKKVDTYKKASWVHDLLKRNPTLNKDCVTVLENNMWRDDLRQAYEDINKSIYSTTVPELKIRRPLDGERAIFFSEYETGDWLAWHNDIYKSTCSYTASYIFNFDDKQFLGGGDFLLSEVSKTDTPTSEKIVTYPYEDNFLIIYPSNALHKVTKVIGYRYSLTYFMDYKE